MTGHDVTATVADLDNGATELTLTGYSLNQQALAGNDGTVATFRIPLQAATAPP